MANGFVLINPESGLAETFDQAGASDAIKRGFQVPLNSPEGEPIAADFEEASRLISEGHSQPTTEQLGKLVRYAKHSTLPEQAKTVGEGALEALTGGLSGLAGNEESLGRAEVNPGLHAIGEGVGTVGGIALAPELSVPGLIAKAGVGTRAAIAGKGILSKAAGIAAQGAIEGGLMGATHALNERLLGDPNATAEHAIGTIGLSSALGGGLGLALAPVGKLAGKLLGDSDVLAPKTFEEVLHGEKEGVLGGLSKLKKNAADIEKAAADIGAPVPEGMISDSKLVQNIDSRLTNSPTTPGQQQALKYKQGVEAAGKALDESLGAYSELSKAEVGNELKKGITEKFKLEEEPISSLFERLKSGVAAEREAGSGIQFQFGYQDIPVTKDEISGVLGRLNKLERANIPGETKQFIAKLEEELPQLDNLQQLKAYRTELNDRLRGKPEFRYALGEAQKGLGELEENSIIRMAERTAPADSPLHQEIKALVDNRKLANKSYSDLIEKMKDIGSVVGKKLRRGEGPGAFLEWLDNAPPEQIATRLFTKNNSEFLAAFANEFPQQAEVLRTYQKNIIRQNALKDGKILPSNVLREVDKLEPEIQKFLFSPEEISKIKAADTYMQAIPKEVNPSGTAKALTLYDWLKHAPSTLIAHAADYSQLQIIKNAVRRFGSPAEQNAANTLIHLKMAAIKTARAIDRHAGAIFGRAVETVNEKKPRRGGSSYEDSGIEAAPLKLNRIGTMVLNGANNPAQLADHLTNSLEGIHSDAPETATAISATVSRAIGFLASKVPDTGRAAPLDAPRLPSPPEIAKFNRYAHVVDEPITVLEHVRHGTILPQDIEALGSVYPTLYSQMKQTVFEKLSSKKPEQLGAIPYQTKLGLSLFLGMPLDSTIQPMAIQTNQGVFAQLPNQTQTPTPGSGTVRPSKVGMGKINTDADSTMAQLATTRRANG